MCFSPEDEKLPATQQNPLTYFICYIVVFHKEDWLSPLFNRQTTNQEYLFYILQLNQFDITQNYCFDNFLLCHWIFPDSKYCCVYTHCFPPPDECCGGYYLQVRNSSQDHRHCFWVKRVFRFIFRDSTGVLLLFCLENFVCTNNQLFYKQ